MTVGSAYTMLGFMWVVVPAGAPVDVELGYTGLKVVADGQCRVPQLCLSDGAVIVLPPRFWRLRTTDGSTVTAKRCYPV